MSTVIAVTEPDPAVEKLLLHRASTKLSIGEQCFLPDRAKSWLREWTNTAIHLPPLWWLLSTVVSHQLRSKAILGLNTSRNHGLVHESADRDYQSHLLVGHAISS
jgi:hypothetical protein